MRKLRILLVIRWSNYSTLHTEFVSVVFNHLWFLKKGDNQLLHSEWPRVKENAKPIIMRLNFGKMNLKVKWCCALFLA